MALHSTKYNDKKFSIVQNFQDFYKSRLPEINKVKGIYEASKILFNLQNRSIELSVAEDDRIYKYTIYTSDVRRVCIGWYVYIPEGRRLDLYLPENPQLPVIQWKDKKPIFKNYPELFDRAGLDNLFSRLVNLT